ncbi:MAG TPA: hypothetical protein DCZ95_18205 [Verrucomicrobia bacterium]|nr:hypothetical protein [Verrucomicrobiota bacterium]
MAELSLAFRQSAYAQETGDFPICLITVAHESLAEPIMISTDPTQRLVETASDIVYGTISRGGYFYFFPCTLKLPDETEEGLGQIKLEFDNTNREYVSAIRSIVGRPEVTVEMVMASDPDSVVAIWPQFLVTRIQYGPTVSLTMEMELMVAEPFPCITFTPGRFPAMFAGGL